MSLFHESILRRALRQIALRTMAWIEETNNWDPGNNGELLLLRAAIKYCKMTYPDSDLTVMDVGANKGAYIDMIASEAKASGTSIWIHAFEPQAKSYSNLLSTHGRERKIKLNQVALSDHDGDSVIFSDQTGSPLASMYERDLRAINITLNQREEIKIIRLDSYIQDLSLKRINFLKIDVEGNEFAVLKGAGDFLRPDFIDFIQFEYGGTNLDSGIPLRSYFSLLEAKGFVVAKVMRGGLRAREYSPWMDNYLYANYVAISPDAFRQLANRN